MPQDTSETTDVPPVVLTQTIEEVEEVETVELCGECDNPLDDCECCSTCNQHIDSCDCTSCERCGDMISTGNGYCCSSYCSSRCAERDNHIHFECGCTSNGDLANCESCNRCSDCVSLNCGDCNRCENCCDCTQEDRGPIESYSSKNYPPANPINPPYTPFLYLGVELEVECSQDDVLGEVAENIHGNHGDKLLLKEDGSLNHGFELVTGKLSLEKHQEFWPAIAKGAVDAGARSWKHKSTGLHVHLSRNWFSQLTIGKLTVFINSPATRLNIVKLAGRECPSYAALKAKKLTCTHSDCRYEAVNLSNPKTIELRIFKGTLNADHILADIEFCHAAAYWVAQVSMQEVESWESFYRYVLKNKKQYRHLVNFFGVQSTTTEGEN
jgi:hypothetical protein